MCIFFIIFLLLLNSLATLNAGLYDNRFFPLYSSVYARTSNKKSALSFWPLIYAGYKSYGDDLHEKIGLYEIFGNYDQSALRRAIITLGGPDFFDTPALQAYKSQEIPCRMHGRIEAQGFGIALDTALTEHWSIGFSTQCMHLFARNNLSLKIDKQEIYTAQDILALDNARRAMNKYLAIKQALWEKTGFADSEAYIRFGGVWDYAVRFRRIDAGLKIGALLPTGITRQVDNPASIAFGADGLWGIYGALDCELELKEDLVCGALLRLNQRFSKTREYRLPVEGEQQLYGALKGLVDIKPDPTFILSLYAALQGIRDGLGLRVHYTAAIHGHDSFVDKRHTKTIALDIHKLSSYSAYRSEYVSVYGLYDFNKIWQDCYNLPTLSFGVDVAIPFLFADRYVKTTRVTLGIQYTY